MKPASSILILGALSGLLIACDSKAESPPPALASSSAQADADTGPDVFNGQRLYRACAVCHTPEKDGRHRIGPNLFGIVGAPAGRHAEFRYSQALRASDITWDASAIDQFITNPQGYLPGNRMSYRGMADADDRADLIAYLETLKD